MPRPITKYLCDFKCGCKAQELKRIEYHELVCFLNPANKTCMTCKFEEYYEDSDGYRNWMQRECLHEGVDDIVFEDLIKKSEYHSEEMFHKHPVRHCPYWEAKDKK